MKTTLISTWLAGAGFGVLISACPLHAQQQPYQAVPPQYQPVPGQAQQPVYPGQYPPRFSQPAAPQTEYVSPVEFLPTFGRKFGDMFRRLFYGDAPPRGHHAQPQAYPPQQGGRSLDHAPGYQQGRQQYPPQAYQQPQPQYAQPQYAQPQAPRYERPPAPGTPAQTRPPQAAAPKTSATPAVPKPSSQTPAKKYTPPTITRGAPAKTSPPPPAVTKTEPAKPDTPPPAPKNETASASRTEYFPLPGSQPKAGTQADAPAATTKPKTEPGSVSGGAFLKGKRTNKEGRVTSPYPPYQELDVSGLGSGSLALDPTTNKVFEVP